MYYLGIDLGGTNIAAGVVNEQYQIIGRSKTKTHVPCSEEEMCSQLAFAALSALEDANIAINEIEWIGIGSPGSIDRTNGMITFSSNLHFHQFPLERLLSEKKIPIISSMGTGNKLDPTQFEIADIYRTSVCPLCRVMRRELKKRDIPKLKVVFSKEVPVKREEDAEVEQDSSKRQTPGSVSFVPPVAGLILASEVIKDLSGQYWPKNQ